MSIANNQVQHDRIMEQGRSMVEMLGVLAIMGLLTIIGIAGFRYALNKHYANQTVNRLMRRAVVVAGQANFGQPLSLHEFDENDGEYKITLLDPTNNESFTMQVENIPQEVCQQILGMDWKLAKMNPDNCSEETINFMFLNELTDCTDCQPDSVDCPPESEMQCGKCSVVKGFMDNNDDCTDSSNPYCVNGKCRQCDTHQFFHTGSHSSSKKDINSCTNCIDSDYWGTTTEYIHACLGIMVKENYYNTPRLFGCHSSYDTLSASDVISCGACPNRCYNPDNQACNRIGEGQAYRRVSAKDATCVCAPNYFWSTQSKGCIACFDDTEYRGWPTTAEYIHACLGTMVRDNYGGNRLLGCHISMEPIAGSEPTSCGACPNRCYNPNDQKCYLAGEGQAHQRVSETDGTCQQ